MNAVRIIAITGRAVLTLACFCAMLSLPRALHSQTVVPLTGGAEIRYRGDTIWRERDTTVTRTIFRGDTAFRTTYVHGLPTSSMAYLVSGDVARVLDARDVNGKPLPEIIGRPSLPVAAVLGERTMLEMAIRNQASMNRIASSGFAPPSNDAPMSPAEIQNYAMSANRNLVQHRDTVRYITGCAAAGPVDTTTYILFANDSVHRLQPSPRSLGRMMALAVRADMSSVLLRQRVSTGPAPDLPGPRKWPCDKR